MQKLKTVIIIAVALIIASCLIYATLNKRATPSEPTGNFTIDKIQTQQGNLHYSVTWHGKNTTLLLLDHNTLYDFPVTDKEVFGITVKDAPVKFYSNGVEIIVFNP